MRHPLRCEIHTGLPSSTEPYRRQEPVLKSWTEAYALPTKRAQSLLPREKGIGRVGEPRTARNNMYSLEAQRVVTNKMLAIKIADRR